jgi:hypothetical protein
LEVGGRHHRSQLAAARPEVIDFLIVHEAPVIELLPETDAEKWRSFVHDIYTKSQRDGWQAALHEFMASLINVPDTPYPPDLNARVENDLEFFFKHEIMPFSQYLPDIERIRNNNVSMVVAVGRDSDDAYYVQASNALAAKLGCENVEFPGHHDVSFWMPEEFANAIRSTLERQRHDKKEAGGSVSRSNQKHLRSQKNHRKKNGSEANDNLALYRSILLFPKKVRM